MIVKRIWIQCDGPRAWQREGWYLFGVLPIYLRDCSARERRNAH